MNIYAVRLFSYTRDVSVCQTAEYEQSPQNHSYSSVTLLPVFQKKNVNLPCLEPHC